MGNGRKPGDTLIRRLLPLYLVIFVAFCGYSLMVTLFVPMLMNENGFVPPGTGIGQRTTLIGILLAIYPLGQLVGSPVIGALSDRYGRKPVLTTSLLISIGAYALLSLGIEQKSLLLMGAACLIGGLAESNIAIVQSAVADITPADERPRLFAWIYSACSVGYIAGPIGGGQLARVLGWSIPFWLASGLLTITLGWVALEFGETHPGEPTRRLDYRAAMGNLLTVFTDRPIRRLYLVNFLFYLALFGYFRVILIYMADVLHMRVGQSTASYSLLAAMSLFASFVLVGPLTRRFGLKRLAIGSAVLSGAAMIAVVLRASDAWFWITAGPACLISTLTLSACAAILANAVAAEREGRVMGNNQALQVGAEALGALIGGVLAAAMTALPLAAFGAVLIATGLLLARTRTPVAAAVATATVQA